MSDTQYYAQDHPEVFKSMVEWIAQNKTVMNISYVFHTGDIVNRGKDQQQWKRADSYINTLRSFTPSELSSISLINTSLL